MNMCRLNGMKIPTEFHSFHNTITAIYVQIFFFWAKYGDFKYQFPETFPITAGIGFFSLLNFDKFIIIHFSGIFSIPV